MSSGGQASSITYKPSEDSPEYLKKAFSYLGTYEVLNGRSNVQVERFIRKYTKQEQINAADVPWCAYWLCYVLDETGYSSTKSGSARSYLTWGEESEEFEGAIVVFWRGKVNDGITGHVGILVKWDAESLWVLGGNQGDRVSIQKFSRNKLLGFRRPRGLFRSKTIKAAATATVSEVTSKALDNVQEVVNSAEQIKEPLTVLSDYVPTIKLVLSAITVISAILIIYYRFSDHKDKGRT